MPVNPILHLPQKPAGQSMPNPSATQPAPETHEDVDLSCESVAGEEDPGASLDLSVVTVTPPPAGAQNVPE